MKLSPCKPNKVTNKILKSKELTAWMKANSTKYTKEQLAERFNITIPTIVYSLRTLKLRSKVKPGYILTSPSKLRWLETNAHRYTISQLSNILGSPRSTIASVLNKLQLNAISSHKALENRAEIFALRRAGWTHKKIADKFSIQANNVCQLCISYHIYPMIKCPCCGELIPNIPEVVK